MSDEAPQAAFLKMMGKAAPVKWETVDMAKRLRELQLDTHFPVELWPSSAATRKLATKFKTASRGDPSFNRRGGVMWPFEGFFKMRRVALWIHYLMSLL